MRRLVAVVLCGLATVPVLLLGSTSTTILCESSNYKFTTCDVSGLGDHIVSVALDQQLSSTSCKQGTNFGLNSTLKVIWVSGGCRGYFTVQVLPTDYSTSSVTWLQRDSTSSRAEVEILQTKLSTGAQEDAMSTENVLTTSASPASDRSTPAWNEQRSSSTTFTETAITTSSRETTFTENVVTTSVLTDPMLTNTSSALCPCVCRHQYLDREADITALPVNRASFSKSRRKKKSAHDGRTSSVVMGTAAVAILCIVAAVFPLLDLEHIVRALKERRHTRNFCSPRFSYPEEHGGPVST